MTNTDTNTEFDKALDAIEHRVQVAPKAFQVTKLTPEMKDAIKQAVINNLPIITGKYSRNPSVVRELNLYKKDAIKAIKGNQSTAQDKEG